MDRTFLASAEHLWRAFATEIGARYEPGDFWSPERIVVERGAETLQVGGEIVGPGRQVQSLPVTAWRVASPRLNGFRLSYARADSGLGVPAERGARFGVATSDPVRAERVLALDWVREAVAAGDLLAITVEPGRLSILVAGSVWSHERLLQMTELALALTDLLAETAPPRSVNPER